MSSNELAYDKNNTLIKQARSCVNPDLSKKLNLHYKTDLRNDKCFIDTQTTQSRGPGQYQTANHYHCECLMPETVNIATNLPAVFFKNGHDVAPCVVDNSTQLRIGKTRKFPKCPNQLFERPYKTTPNMMRGPSGFVYPAEELNLLSGEPTTTKRQCNTLSGITIEHQWTPLIDHLKNNIQSPQHIIEEEHNWVRGGILTHNLINDFDYLQRCGYSYMDKEMNSEFWEDKHLNL